MLIACGHCVWHKLNSIIILLLLTEQFTYDSKEKKKFTKKKLKLKIYYELFLINGKVL